jgi:triacylglycerol lipase
MGERVGDLVADLLPDAVRQSSYDPVPAPAPPEKAWWGRPFAELRWQAELARLVVDPVYAGRGVPRGDGGPVLLIPGFLAGDASLSVMGSWLRRIGHTPYAAGILANVDCSDRAVDRLERLLLRVHVKTGRQVALVGHSRGGHFAKALAARHPDGIRTVVSMGAGLDEPFDISLPTQAAVTAVRSVLRRVDPSTARRGCLTTTCDCPFVRDYTAPWPESVPLTSIYSQGDGVVRWRSCVVPYARSVQVRSSHVGLAFNRHAYRAVADALAP